MKLSDTEELIACIVKKVAKKTKDFSSLRSAMYAETRLAELCFLTSAQKFAEIFE